jgi:5S rRNA maturation endonuclease (ribonuclease M5)
VTLDSKAPDGFLVNTFSPADDPIACKDYVRARLGLPAFAPNGHKRRHANRSEVESFMAAAIAQQRRETPPSQIVATYDYKDADGTLLYQQLRFDPKDFRLRRPDGNGGWVWKLDERRVVYRWPELLQFSDATVFVCEGEKDADRVAGLGLCSTTVAAGKWTADCVEALAGRDVVILEDNDEAGRKKALQTAQALHGTAKTIRVVALPDLPDKGDVSEWLDADVSRAEKLEQICFDAPEWAAQTAADAKTETAATTSEAPTPAKTAGLGEWDAGDDVDPPPPRGWLLGNIFCRGFMSSLLGDGGSGKTATRYAQLMSLATGRALTGEYVFERCRVLIVSLEDDDWELRRRILAARLHHGVELSEMKGWLFLATPGAAGGKLMTIDKNGRLNRGALADKLEATITARKIDLVYLDPFIKSHSVGENDNTAIDEVAQVLTDLAAKHDIAIDTPHHVSKGAPDPGNANRGRGASAQKDAGRLVYTLSPMSTDEAQAFGLKEEERRLLVRMDSGKVNIAPPMSKAQWFRLIGVPLGNATDRYPNGDNVQTIEPWTPPDTWADLNSPLLNRILDDIDAGLPDGNRYSDGPNVGDRAAWKVVVEQAPTKTEAQAREIVKTWVKNGLLKVEQYENPQTRKMVKGLRVDPTKRPS